MEVVRDTPPAGAWEETYREKAKHSKEIIGWLIPKAIDQSLLVKPWVPLEVDNFLHG